MSGPRPLSYDSLKYVMQYLDANLRFTLSQRCPPFTTIERITPLRIHNLDFNSDFIKINDATYTIGVIRVYKNGQAPEFVQIENSEGGIRTDVDRYGISVTEERNDQQQVATHKDQIKWLEALLRVSQTTGQYFGGDIRAQIARLESKMLSYTLRLEDTEPPFVHYLQLSVESGNTVRKELVNYDRSIIDAKEYLMNRLFGGEGRTVHVHLLNIGKYPCSVPADFDIPNPLLPLAPGKLEVDNIQVMVKMGKALNSVRPVLWNQPLKSLITFMGIEGDQVINQDPIISSVKQLVIKGKYDIRLFPKYPHEKVHFEFCIFNKQRAASLVTTWQETGVGAGKCYSMGFSDEDRMGSLLKFFEELPDAQKRKLENKRHTKFPHVLIVPIRDDTELNVYCEETSLEDKLICDDKYILKINVQPRGNVSF